MSNWQPSASLEMLRDRALLLSQIRQFFAKREVLEVETPSLSRYANPDSAIDSIGADIHATPGSGSERFYLQTSPEFFMKRLLAAGCGSIFQVCRAYRDGESGKHHNPEFSMLEWYRTGFSMNDLIDEVDLLMQSLISAQEGAAERIEWHTLFQQCTGLDLRSATISDIRYIAGNYGIVLPADNSDAGLVEILFDIATGDWMRQRKGVIVSHFPASQASLALLSPEDSTVALRFEYYYKGVELANGFQELADADEQKRRFEVENSKRLQSGKPDMPIDDHLLSALSHGLPDSSGVAAGIDRILMMRNKLSRLDAVIPFPLSHT